MHPARRGPGGRRRSGSGVEGDAFWYAAAEKILAPILLAAACSGGSMVQVVAWLDTQETEAFGDLLLELAKEGLAILLVEHDVELVMRVCELIHVLDFGKKIAEGPPSEIKADPRVQAAYLGADEEAAPDEEVVPS